MAQSPLFHALGYYLKATSANQLAMAVEALKSPRNLGVVTVVALIGGFAVSQFPYRMIADNLIQDFTAQYLLVIAMLLEVSVRLAAGGGITSFSEGLRFNQSDVEFFFAAPLSRREVVLFKILNIHKLGLLGVLPVSVIAPLVFDSLSFLRLLLGLSLVFTVALVSYFLLRYLISFLAIKGLKFLAQIGLYGFVAAIGFNGWLVINQAQAQFHNLAKFNQTPAFANFTGPIDWLIAPALSSSWADFGQTFWLPLLLCVGLIGVFYTRRFHYAMFEHYVCGAGRSDDKSNASAKNNNTTATIKSSQSLPTIAAIGPQYQAIVWKSIMASNILRSASKRFYILGAMAGVVALSLSPLTLGGKYIVAALLFTVLISQFLIGPWVFRGGLRRDMPYLDLLKSMPISGRQLIFGAMVVPVLASFVIVALTAFCLALVVDEPMITVLQNERKWFMLLALLPLAFSLIATRFTIHNLFALHLPSFVSFNPNSGAEFYQMFFRGAVSVLLFVAMSFPALMLVGLLFANAKLVSMIPPQWLWVIAVNTGALVLLAESLALIYFSDARYQNFDISQENTTK